MNRRSFGTMVLGALAGLAVSYGERFKVAELHVADGPEQPEQPVRLGTTAMTPDWDAPVGLSIPSHEWTTLYVRGGKVHIPVFA